MERFRRSISWIAAAAITVAVGGSALAGGSGVGNDSRTPPWRAKNVILIIGDGMGDSEITLARNYTAGAGGELALDGLPYTGQMTTYSVQESDPSLPDYTSESASTATAWSTGQKTADGRISTSASTDQDLTTFLETAQGRGMKTGVVSTADITDATNAAAMSHVASRGCQGPANMASCPQDAKENGGPGSIAEQAVDHGVDVLLGGGSSRFEQTITGGPDVGLTVLDSAAAKGYELVGTRDELLAADGSKLLGLFTPSHMSVDWTGAAAANPPSGPQRCLEGQRPDAEPSLAEMTAKALDVLTDRNRKGFFLQVESASIDKRDHVSQPCEQIGETVNLDETVALVMAFAARNPGTLVIVTADHAHTSQITEVDATPAGSSSILLTDEGGEMLVTYGTGSTADGQQHTGSQVRVAAKGPQGWNVVGLIDQTELFGIMERAIGAW